MIGYRKLIGMCVATLSTSALAFLGSIESGTFQVVMVATVGGFFAANVYSNTKQEKV